MTKIISSQKKSALKKSTLSALFVAGVTSVISFGAYAAELITPFKAPLVSQMYADGGEVKDSRYCYAFTLANLMGRQFGVSVAPVDIAIQYIKVWPTVSSEQMFPTKYGWGGEIDTVFSALKQIGYCTNTNFDKYQKAIMSSGLNWYLSLNHQSELKSPNRIFNDVDIACGERLKVGASVTLKWEYNQPSYPLILDSSTARRFISKINELLSAGRYVALGYDGHYVTIIGRTDFGEYIIQDSIPNSYRQLNIKRNLYHKVEGEHLQIWTQDELNVALHFSTVTGAIPGIGYLEQE